MQYLESSKEKRVHSYPQARSGNGGPRSPKLGIKEFKWKGNPKGKDALGMNDAVSQGDPRRKDPEK